MGYTPKKKQYKLVFADPDMNGLEVYMNSVPVGVMLQIDDLSSSINVSDSGSTSGKFRELLEIVASALVSWNIEEEDGTAVPADFDGLSTLETQFVMEIIAAWSQAVAGVTGPLEKGSTSGGTFPEASLPMEPLSPSQEN
jgi:hypothetical protein